MSSDLEVIYKEAWVRQGKFDAKSGFPKCPELPPEVQVFYEEGYRRGSAEVAK